MSDMQGQQSCCKVGKQDELNADKDSLEENWLQPTAINLNTQTHPTFDGDPAHRLAKALDRTLWYSPGNFHRDLDNPLTCDSTSLYAGSMLLHLGQGAGIF